MHENTHLLMFRIRVLLRVNMVRCLEFLSLVYLFSMACYIMTHLHGADNLLYFPIALSPLILIQNENFKRVKHL